MRSIATMLTVMLIALLLRSTALSPLAARGVVLDVLAFATAVWALRRGEGFGASLGFVLGLAADLDAAHWLGRHALALSLMGYAVGRLSRTLVRDSARTQFVVLFACTLIHQVWCSGFEVGTSGAWMYPAGRAVLAAAISATLGTLLLAIVRRLVGQPLFGHAVLDSGSTN